MKRYIVWGLLIVVPCYFFDQWTKWLVYSQYDIGQVLTVIPGFFDIIHMRNTGAAFGILRDIDAGYRTLFFGLVTIVACASLIYIIRTMEYESRLLTVVMFLIIAGALGNLTDRLMFNEVVDFLSIYIGKYRWPTFNMADTYISIGMAGLLLHLLLTSKKTDTD